MRQLHGTGGSRRFLEVVLGVVLGGQNRVSGMQLYRFSYTAVEDLS